MEERQALGFSVKVKVRKIGKKKQQRHYCRICGLQKSNESFSGKGHAIHICKDCARLSPAEQSKSVTINRLMTLPFRRLNENKLNWLKNRTKDSREEVRTMAKEIYSQCFPHGERNQMKKQLHIKELIFTANAYSWDEYGDEIPANSRFYMMRSEPVISMQAPDGLTEPVTVRLEQGKYSKLLKSLIHYYELFCWNQDYGSGVFSEDDDPDFYFDDTPEPEDLLEKEANTVKADPTWSVSVKYTNGTEQTIQGTDNYLPDKVGELYLILSELFKLEEEPDWEQADFNQNG